MAAVVNRPDGLYLMGQASLAELIQDEQLSQFAAGLAVQAIERLEFDEPGLSLTLAEVLHYPDPFKINPLLAVLLVLDAEINTTIEETRCMFPLPGFMSYRPRLPLAKVPLDSVRLPLLNPDGNYQFKLIGPAHYLVVRLDIQPILKVAGHIRIAIASPTRLAQRIQAAEDRLDRQYLSAALIEAALDDGNQELAIPLTVAEQASLGTAWQWSESWRSFVCTGQVK
jgi:hypothetical protein